MSTLQAHRNIYKSAPRRSWIVETLVVLGVLAFGYFAVTLDSPRWAPQPDAIAIDPLTDFAR